jgi:Peptidase propeptide and YPEB domain
VVVAVLLFAFFVARSCQQDQIRITEEQAIATAEQQIDFTPEETQIRLLRQGIDTRPFWIVSLSIPRGENEDSFRRLALVHIDANTGKVTKVEEQQPGAAGQKREQ